MNSIFFENFSGFSSGRIFTSSDIVLFSCSINDLSRQAINKKNEWYTTLESSEFEGMKSRKRYAEKLSGKYCAKRALAFFLQQKDSFTPNFMDFSIVSKDHPVMIITEDPDLSALSSACFCSISHSSDIAVAAVSDCLLGVDIEFLRKLHSNIAESIISPVEKAVIQGFLTEHFQLSEELFPVAVFTCKEAVLKALGCGIAGGLLQVELKDYSEQEGLLASYRDKLFRIRCLVFGDMFLSLAFPVVEKSVSQYQHYTG